MNKKKWTKEECRDRYVYGERIGIRSLTKLSNNVHSTVARWCAEDKWTELRDRYQIALRSETEAKIISETSDRLSDELVKLNEEHIKGSELFRKMAQQFAGILATEIQNTDCGDRVKKLTNKEFTLAVNRYANVFATAVSLQRQATGMQYLDINNAIEQIIKAGYDVSEPDN